MTVGGGVVVTRRRVRDQLRAILANDSVRNLIWLYYFWFIAWSVYGSFKAYPIARIADPMGIAIYDLWVWSPLVAGPAALIGLALRHGGSPAADIQGNLLRRDFLGLWMQVGGHAWMTLVLGVYIATAALGTNWAAGEPVPSVFWLSAFFQGAAFLCAQSVYKVGLGARWWR